MPFVSILFNLWFQNTNDKILAIYIALRRLEC